MVPPDGVVPGKPLIQRFPLPPALAHEGIEAVVKNVLIQQVFRIVDGVRVIEIAGHRPGHTVRRAGENIGIHGKDDPLGLVRPHEKPHHLIELTEVAVRDGKAQTGSAEHLADLAAPVVGRHGGTDKNHVRRVVSDDSGRLITLAEKDRLTVCGHPIVKAGIYPPDKGGAGHQHQNQPQKQAQSPFTIGMLFHGRVSFLRNWNR